MPSYLIETYLGPSTPGGRDAQAARARSAAAGLAQQGLQVSVERSIHVPEDELCFFVFEAPDRQTAALAAERASLDPLRIVAAQWSDEHHT